MPRVTLDDLRNNTRIPECLNIPPNDSRFVVFINESVKRLMTKGLFWGSFSTFDISVTSRLMSLPPQIETLEAIAISLVPLPIRDTFYQFIDAGWGQRDETATNGSGISECFYLNNFPVVTDVATPYSTLTLMCDLATDVGKTITLLGYDSNGNWIRTIQGGVYADGEVVSLAQSPIGTATSKVYSKITDIQAPSTLDGQWWLYQGSTMLGNYQYWETRPSYKRYLVPFVSGNTVTARVIGRRTYVPVKNGTDYPIIGNAAALKLACMAIRAEEEQNYSLASVLWNGGMDKNGNPIMGAKQELDAELQFQLGVGREVAIDIKAMPYVEPVPVLM